MWECAGCYKKQQELTEETKASPSGRRAKSSEPLAEKIKQSQSILVKISLIGGTTHKDVVWEEAGLLESVCSALGLLTWKYNRQEKRLYSQAIGLKREQTDSNSHASCHTTSLSVVLSLQSTITSDTFLTTLRNPNNQRIHLFLEVFSVLLLQCICQYSGPAILTNWTSVTFE